MPTPYIILAKIGRTYGIKGWFHLIPFTEDLNNLFKQRTWYLKDREEWQALELEAYRSHGNGFIAKLKGYDVPELSRHLTNREIAIPRSELTDLKEDEYYWSDLIGLAVYTSKEVYLGKVIQLLETGANDVLCVKDLRERMIPYIDSVIKKVDLKNNRITVDWDPDF